MRQYKDKSPSNIEREVAGHRADIAETVAEIKEQLSPAELLDRILRDSRTRDVVARIGPAIARNPLPAVLIGVGALWLALESTRPEPLPAPRKHRLGPGSPAAMAVGKETVMAASRDNLTAWLRDAYAMENQAIEILEKQANRLEHYPELRAKVRSHLDETHRHAERVERCLHQLGTDTSGLKTALGKMVGTAQQLSACSPATRC